MVSVERKGGGPEAAPTTIEFAPSGHDRLVELATNVDGAARAEGQPANQSFNAGQP